MRLYRLGNAVLDLDKANAELRMKDPEAVSYTHLTLPTKA